MKIVAPNGRQVEVRPTIPDRVANWWNAENGVRRLKARAHSALLGGYDGGRRDRRFLRNWRVKDTDANSAILGDLPDLRARSDELVRNAPIATGVVSTNITHSIGTGLQLQASIDPDALGVTSDKADLMEKEQEREFSLFCETCDFTRAQSFDEMQPTALRSVLQSGDLFFMRRFRKDAGDVYGTKLQMVVGARVCNPNFGADTNTTIAGVEIDKDGVPQAYQISDKHPGALRVGNLNWERVPARAKSGRPLVIHLYDRLLPDQTRGVPYLAPVIETLKTMARYTEAECAAAVVSAYFTVFIKGASDSDETPATGERSSGDNLEDNETKLGPGAVHMLGQGEEIQEANPGRPNAAFDPFMTAILRQIGVALEIPFELLIKHFESSYSASRAALEMGWLYFKKQRTWLARRLCQVVYEWCIEEAVASGRINRPGFFEDPFLRKAYLRANWIGPARISIDPEKEARADSIDININRVKTREQVVLERIGGRVEDNIRQLGKEQRLIEQEGLPEPAGSSVAATATAPADNSSDNSGDNPKKPQRKGAST